MKKFLSITWSFLKYILIYLGVNGIVGVIAGIFIGIKQAINPNGPSFQELLSQNLINITLVVSIISLIFFIILIRYEHKSFINYINYKKISIKTSLLCVLTTTGYAFFSVSFVNLLIEYFPKYKDVSDTMVTTMNTLIGLISIILLIPIFEEIFFRGIIFKELKGRINIIASIIVSALIFAIFHWNLLQSLYTFIFGVILALMYAWTNSLWSNTLSHVTYNLLGTLVVPQIVYYTSMLSILYVILGALVSVFGIYMLNKNKLTLNQEVKESFIIDEE